MNILRGQIEEPTVYFKQKSIYVITEKFNRFSISQITIILYHI